MRKNDRAIKKTQRDIERERADLERQEKKLVSNCTGMNCDWSASNSGSSLCHRVRVPVPPGKSFKMLECFPSDFKALESPGK